MSTVGDIIGEAKIKADMERSKFVSEAAWIKFFNNAYAELYDLLIGSYQNYYLKSNIVTVSGGIGEASLPADFYKLKGIDREGEEKPIPSFNFEERLTSVLDLSYMLSATSLMFLPKEKADGTFTVWYVANPFKATAISDTVPNVHGWEEYLAYGMAIRALEKEESFEQADRLQAHLSVMAKNIEALSKSRDSKKKRVIRDVRWSC